MWDLDRAHQRIECPLHAGRLRGGGLEYEQPPAGEPAGESFAIGVRHPAPRAHLPPAAGTFQLRALDLVAERAEPRHVDPTPDAAAPGPGGPRRSAPPPLD